MSRYFQVRTDPKEEEKQVLLHPLDITIGE